MPVWGAMIAALFGPPAFGQVMGLAFLVMMPLAVAGPPLAGAIFDATRSYAPLFQLLVASYAVAALALAFQGPARSATRASGATGPLSARRRTRS